jgi:hypothetical protein
MTADNGNHVIVYTLARHLFRAQLKEIFEKTKPEKNQFSKELCSGADGKTSSYICGQRCGYNIDRYSQICRKAVQLLYTLTVHEVQKTVERIKN